MKLLRSAALLVAVVTELLRLVVAAGDIAHYSHNSYPDLRGKNHRECGDHILSKSSFICDPQMVLTAEEATILNGRLLQFAKNSSSQCECRPAQCFSNDVEKNEFRIGFVLAMAIVRNLQTTSMSPDPDQVETTIKAFARSVHGSWALGDCGNAALLVFWEQSRKLYLHLSDSKSFLLYMSPKEGKSATDEAQNILKSRGHLAALLYVIDAVTKEFAADPYRKTDTGFIALMTAISVAVFLVIIITGCVCAFRCCGNLRPQPDSALGRTWERVGSISAEVIRRGTIIRRSFSRSPKTSHVPRNPQQYQRSDVNCARMMANEEGLSMV